MSLLLASVFEFFKRRLLVLFLLTRGTIFDLFTDNRRLVLILIDLIFRLNTTLNFLQYAFPYIS